MAEKRNVDTGQQSQSQRGLSRASESSRGIARRDPFDLFEAGPFAMMRRLQDDVDRLFGGFGGHSWGAPAAERQRMDWTPAIEAFHRGNEFVIRADVPGLSRDDLTVEVGDDALTIRGERKYDHEEEREGFYRSERSYGSFYRVVPLPEGAMGDNAKANFKDGVLEVVIPAPSQEVRRGRRIEIGEGTSQERGKQSEPRK